MTRWPRTSVEERLDRLAWMVKLWRMQRNARGAENAQQLERNRQALAWALRVCRRAVKEGR